MKERKKVSNKEGRKIANEGRKEGREGKEGESQGRKE